MRRIGGGHIPLLNLTVFRPLKPARGVHRLEAHLRHALHRDSLRHALGTTALQHHTVMKTMCCLSTDEKTEVKQNADRAHPMTTDQGALRCASTPKVHRKRQKSKRFLTEETNRPMTSHEKDIRSTCTYCGSTVLTLWKTRTGGNWQQTALELEVLRVPCESILFATALVKHNEIPMRPL